MCNTHWRRHGHQLGPIWGEGDSQKALPGFLLPDNTHHALLKFRKGPFRGVDEIGCKYKSTSGLRPLDRGNRNILPGATRALSSRAFGARNVLATTVITARAYRD